MASLHGAIPFWSWNDKLSEDRLRKQIRDMHELGMTGFFMHARGGLETEYLSDDWFNCINICIDEAKKLGMEAWSYDENGWPSGFAGGELLKDKANFAVSIRKKICETFPETDEDTIAVYVKNDDGTFTLVSSPVEGTKEYLLLYKGYDSSYVDVLDKNIIDKFIQATHQVYKDRLAKEDFGTTMPGFFTDEPQYNRWDNPYSNILPAEFEKAYGYSIYDKLPAVFFDFDGAEKFRFDYYKLLHNLFINSFIKNIYEWCDANGVKLTGHAVEETSLGGQMMCIGGCMPFYQYEHIPGIDYLGRGIQDDIAPKQLGSVCAQIGNKQAISEMYGCCGWDVTPLELKRITDVQFANGVNIICSHLYPYSEKGQRKRDYPNHYSEHNMWQSHLKEYHEYYTKLGDLLAEGEEYAPVLVIHPIHGAYMKYKKWTNSLDEIDGKFFELSRLLGYNQIPYHYGDEIMMSDMAEVIGDKIKVGRCEYSTVVVPFTYSLDKSTCELLKTYIANGGKVWIFSDKPYAVDGEKSDMSWLESNITFEDVLSTRDAVVTKNGEKVGEIRKMTRITDKGSVIYLTNVTDNELVDTKVTVSGISSPALYDVVTEEKTPICGIKKLDGDGYELTLNFEKGQSYIIVENGSELKSSVVNKAELPAIEIPETVKIAEMPVNMLTLDRCEVSYNGTDYEEILPIEGVRDNLLRSKYKGEVWLRYSFDIEDGYLENAKNLRLVTEPMRIISASVNGNEIEIDKENTFFDPDFASTDIIKYAKTGRNKVTIRLNYFQRDYVYYVLYGGVSESLRNCLWFDTEIEAVYILGDFRVKTDGTFASTNKQNAFVYDGTFSIESPKECVNIRDIVKDGYPFYAGRFSFEFDYDYKNDMPTEISLDGRYAVAEITVNGVKAGTLMFSKYMDISEFLKEGNNKIGITICNSARNLMGPHHRDDPEPYGVGPGTFSFEREWNGRECKGYKYTYAFVRYGVE